MTKQDKQDEKDYNDLFQRHSEVQRQYKRLMKKQKASVQKIAKLSNEVATLKLRLQGAPSSEAPLRKTSESRRGMEEKDELLEVISKRLADAEKELHRLKLESAVEKASNSFCSDDDSQNQIAKLKTHLHELATQHKLDTLRMSLQEEKLKKILSLHTEYATRHTALKKQLRYSESERNQMEEYKEEVFELREQNHFLEQQVTKLCDVGHNDDDIQTLKTMLSQKDSANEILLQEVIKLQEENERLRLLLRQSDEKAKEIKHSYRELEHLALEEAKLSDSSDFSDTTS